LILTRSATHKFCGLFVEANFDGKTSVTRTKATTRSEAQEYLLFATALMLIDACRSLTYASTQRPSESLSPQHLRVF